VERITWYNDLTPGFDSRWLDRQTTGRFRALRDSRDISKGKSGFPGLGERALSHIESEGGSCWQTLLCSESRLSHFGPLLEQAIQGIYIRSDSLQCYQTYLLQQDAFLCLRLPSPGLFRHHRFHLSPRRQNHLLPSPLQERLPLCFVLTPRLPLFLLVAFVPRGLLFRRRLSFSLTRVFCNLRFEVISCDQVWLKRSRLRRS